MKSSGNGSEQTSAVGIYLCHAAPGSVLDLCPTANRYSVFALVYGSVSWFAAFRALVFYVIVVVWKMGKASKVWNHFTRPFNNKGGKKVVKCLDTRCGEELAYRDTTTNLRNHVQVKHKIELPSLPPKGGKKKRSFSFSTESQDEEVRNIF